MDSLPSLVSQIGMAAAYDLSAPSHSIIPIGGTKVVFTFYKGRRVATVHVELADFDGKEAEEVVQFIVNNHEWRRADE